MSKFIDPIHRLEATRSAATGGGENTARLPGGLRHAGCRNADLRAFETEHQNHGAEGDRTQTQPLRDVDGFFFLDG